jgi:hypothetical protein
MQCRVTKVLKLIVCVLKAALAEADTCLWLYTMERIRTRTPGYQRFEGSDYLDDSANPMCPVVFRWQEGADFVLHGKGARIHSSGSCIRDVEVLG